MNRIILALAALGAALSLSACGAFSDDSPPLAGAAIGGPFTLTDQDGHSVRDTDFAGKYRIMYFGYTLCPDVCPVDVQNIAAGMRLFEQQHPDLAAKVVPIFITVDPERDDVDKVRQFVRAFHPRMVGLTGSAQAIADVTRRYGDLVQKEQTPGNPSFLVNHSRTAYLMGPDGKPIATLPAEQSGEAVSTELARWVK